MQEQDRRLPTIGILYPGEMGTSLGRLLVEHGFPVVTTVEGRSPRTCRLCTEARLRAVESFEQVVAQSQIVISLVPPDAALAVAERFCGYASLLACAPTYLDANSISPGTMAEIERPMARCGASLVDATIHGLASRLRQQGTLYLSGGMAAEVGELLGGVLRVCVLGAQPGMASMFKMLLGGTSKTMVGLFLQMSLVAREVGLLNGYLAECGQYYPGVMEAIGRMLPTVPRHARRRAAEMEEFEHTLQRLGLRSGLAAEIRRLYALIGASGVAGCAGAIDFGTMTTGELVEWIGSRVSLDRDAADAVPAVASSI